MKYFFVLVAVVTLSCQDPSLLLPDLSSNTKSLQTGIPLNFVSPGETVALDLVSADPKDILFVEMRDDANNLLNSEPLLRSSDSRIASYSLPNLNTEGILSLNVRSSTDKVITIQKILYSKESINVKSVNILPVYAVVKGKSVLKFELSQVPKGSFWARFTLSNQTLAYKKYSEKSANLFFDTPLLPGTYEVKMEIFPSGLERVDDSISSSLSTKTNLIVTDTLFFSRKLDFFGPRFLYTNLFLFEGETLDWALFSEQQNDLRVDQYLATNGDDINLKVPSSEAIHPITWQLLPGGIPGRQLVQLRYVDSGTSSKTIFDTLVNGSSVLNLKQIDARTFVLTLVVGNREEFVTISLDEKKTSQTDLILAVVDNSSAINGYIKINDKTQAFSFSSVKPDTKNLRDGKNPSIELEIAKESSLISTGAMSLKKMETVKKLNSMTSFDLVARPQNDGVLLLPISQGESFTYEVPNEVSNLDLILYRGDGKVLSAKQFVLTESKTLKALVTLDGKNVKLNLNGLNSNFGVDTTPLYAELVLRPKSRTNELQYSLKKIK